jgi:glycosyltransferase involved in cell wall biosynthesis
LTAGPTEDLSASRNEFFKAFPHLNGKQYLLFLSRIHVKKGCDLLFDAFADVMRARPEIQLVMAGPDQTGWRPALEARANSLGISDRITWTGMISGAVKSGAFVGADAFILPTHQENFGIAVTEAISHGTPVLISDKVNIWREIIEDGAGIAAPDTLDGTKQLLTQWLELAPDKKAAMRQATTTCFDARFGISGAATRLLKVIGGQSTVSLS